MNPSNYSLSILSTHTQLADEILLQGYHLIDNFLAEEHFLALSDTIKETHNNGYFNQARIGHKLEKTYNSTIRNDQIFWLDNDGCNVAISGYFTEMDKLCNTLNQALFLGLTNYEAHFAIYQPNNFYKKHVDQFATTQDRRISCVYYLNDSWQQEFGGELILYDKNDQPLSTIMPLGNRFICFNSDMAHEVSTAYQTRYSIATWLKVRPMTMII